MFLRSEKKNLHVLEKWKLQTYLFFPFRDLHLSCQFKTSFFFPIVQNDFLHGLLV